MAFSAIDWLTVATVAVCMATIVAHVRRLLIAGDVGEAAVDPPAPPPPSRPADDRPPDSSDEIDDELQGIIDWDLQRAD